MDSSEDDTKEDSDPSGRRALPQFPMEEGETQFMDTDQERHRDFNRNSRDAWQQTTRTSSAPPEQSSTGPQTTPKPSAEGLAYEASTPTTSAELTTSGQLCDDLATTSLEPMILQSEASKDKALDMLKDPNVVPTEPPPPPPTKRDWLYRGVWLVVGLLALGGIAVIVTRVLAR